jgi:hypothetical protein
LIVRLIQFGHLNLNNLLVTLHLTKIAELYIYASKKSIETGKLALTKVHDFKNWIDQSYITESQKAVEYYHELKDYSNTKITDLRKWIDTSFLSTPLSIPFMISDKAMLYTNSTKLFLFEKVYTPIREVTVTYGGCSINFIIKNSEKVKEQGNALALIIKDKIDTIYADVKDVLLDGKDSYFKIKTDEQYLIFSLNKKLLYFPLKFFELINFVVESVKKIEFSKLKDQTLNVYSQAKTQVEVVSSFLVDKYKYFLGRDTKKVATNEDNEKKLN